MKLHIAICDDEATEIEYLTELVQEWAAAEKISVAISAYDSSEAFLFAYDANKTFDILLLDIYMKQMDGVALAKRLRTVGGLMQIIFITGLPDFISEGYEVSALHYLLKPVDKEKLFSVLDKAIGLLSNANESIIIDTDNGQVKLLTKDIVYVEAFAHTTNIETVSGTYTAKLSIGDLEEYLGDTFFRCHRSYIVGLRHIRQITKNDIIIDSGKVIPLSRRRYATANIAFIRYYKGVQP